MKANARHLKKQQKQTKNDEAVSPVIAVILMVAITVVLAATVYVWVSGFASEDSGPEQASATARGFAVGGSDTNWIRVTMVKGENAPYNEDNVGYTVLAPDGSSQTASSAAATSDDYLCTSASASGGTCNAVDFHTGADTNSWDVGGVLYIPCQASGDHSVTITVRGTTVLDSSVKCDAAA